MLGSSKKDIRVPGRKETISFPETKRTIVVGVGVLCLAGFWCDQIVPKGPFENKSLLPTTGDRSVAQAARTIQIRLFSR